MNGSCHIRWVSRPNSVTYIIIDIQIYLSVAWLGVDIVRTGVPKKVMCFKEIRLYVQKLFTVLDSA